MWSQLAPRACTGGVFIEFRPPLTQPGPFRFALELDEQDPICEFEVALPASNPVYIGKCKLRLELQTRGVAKESSIVGLTVGASPKKLHLTVRSEAALIYDSRLHPKYATEPTPRSESKHFCGPRATVTPDCIRGTSQCAPYPSICDGPEDCPANKVCCVSSDSALEYGARFGSQCTSARYCIGRLAHIACHRDEDCPSRMGCTDGSLASEFKPELRGCLERP